MDRSNPVDDWLNFLCTSQYFVAPVWNDFDAIDKFQPQALITAVDTTLPGISQYKMHVPVRVTNVQLMSPPFLDKTWGAVQTFSDDTQAQEYLKG